MITPIIVKNVYAVYPRCNRTWRFDNAENRSVPCGPLEDGAAYEMSFRIKKDDAKELWNYVSSAWKEFCKETGKKGEMVNKPFKEDETDPSYLIWKCKLKGAYSGQATKPPAAFNAANQPITDPDFELTTGSIINISLKAVPYATGMAQGVSLRLLAYQVIEMSTVAGGASPFEADPAAMEQMGELYKDTTPEVEKAAAPAEEFNDDIPF